MTKKDTVKMFAMMQEVYPKSMFQYTEQTIVVWHEMLSDLDYDMVIAAIKKHAITDEWPPSIAHIRGACVDIVNPQIDVSTAWNQLWMLVKPPNSPPSCADEWDRKVKNTCPIVMEIYQSIGNFNIYQSDERFFRPEFEKLYSSMAKARRTGMMLSPDIAKMIETSRAAIADNRAVDVDDEHCCDGILYLDFAANG